MPLETTPFDAAEYLGSPEAQVELLRDALETGEAGYIAHALGVIVRARGMTQVAREAGLSREALYKALSPTGNPTLSTLLGVIKALNIRLDAASIPAGVPTRADPATT
ncbi:MAG: addiction module antidote protein [Hyphomicrobiaceae bacterium]